MNTRLLFPRVLVVCVSLFLTAGVVAQGSEADSLPASAAKPVNRMQTEPTLELSRPRTVTPVPVVISNTMVPTINLTRPLDQMLLTAIQSHIGVPYHFNRTGPESFDCSGLVWRAYQDIGVDFQRGPARSYWAMFEVPPENEQFKFGTLVFFSNLSHVGIVVDEKGFYHSARHGGVMYSLFNDYWVSRIDGFRRVPIGALQTATAVSQPRVAKPVTQALVEQNNQR